MTTAARFADATTIPAGEPIPATRRIPARDVAIGDIIVQDWHDGTTILAIVATRSVLCGREQWTTVSGGTSSTLPDAWVTVAISTDATAAGVLAELRRTMLRWNEALAANLERYRREGSDYSAHGALSQLSVVDDILKRIARA